MDRRAIIDLKNGKLLWEDENVLYINYKSNETKVEVQYKGSKRALIDLESGEVAFDEESYKKWRFGE